jgi:hypothetical protein
MSRPTGPSITAALLGVLVVLASCSAGDAPSSGPADGAARASADAAAAASDPSPAPPNPVGSPPPLNRLEAKVVDALNSLGIDGQRAEYSTPGAFIWAPFDSDSAVYLHAYPTGTNRGESSVLSGRVIEGHTVQHVQYSTGPVRERFECADVTYEAEGSTPPGFDSFDAFLADLIDALECSESGTQS